MKKYILMMIALFGFTAAASAQKVYIAPSKSAIAYHKSKDCSYLKNSVNVTSVTTADAKNMGRHACVRCYPEKAKETMKAIEKEKKQTTAKKSTTKAATTKKATPERDEKGRFVKKTTTETKAAAKKATPERDEKGRFVKKTTTETKAAAKKATPERDEKGRFVKKSTTETKAA
ncbi:MAG: hypothetical protein IKC86_06540, partial [Prevotella sp.]|nr:hypothetical protein [Prevotella sp.]